MARPGKLTPAAEATVLAALRQGNTETLAGQLVGVSRSTFKRWKKRIPEFGAAVVRAQTEAQQYAVGKVRSAMGEHWQAAAWWLERRYPEDWARQVNLVLVLQAEGRRLAAERGLDPAVADAAVARLLEEALPS